jgi:hypothetical protein
MSISQQKAEMHTSIVLLLCNLSETVWSIINAEFVIWMGRIKKIDFAWLLLIKRNRYVCGSRLKHTLAKRKDVMYDRETDKNFFFRYEGKKNIPKIKHTELFQQYHEHKVKH